MKFSEIVGGVDEEDRSLPQEIDTYSKGLMTAAKMDLIGVLQLEDEPRFSPPTLFDGTVHLNPEGSLTKSVPHISSLSVSAVKVRLNSTVIRWLGFRTRQSVKT